MEKLNEKLIPIFIIIQPILDMLVVLTPRLQISTVIRGLFFMYMLFFLLKYLKTRKLTIVLLISMIIYILYNSIYLTTSLSLTISSVFKLYYIIFIILFFLNIKTKNVSKYLLISLTIYISIFLISYIFNIGYSNYVAEEKKVGYRGLFNSINEISAILVTLYYYAYNYLKSKKIYLIILTVLLFIISYLTGTKVLLGGLLFIIFINIAPTIISKWKKQNNSVKILMIILSIILVSLLIYLFLQTNTYKNMVVQAKFFKVETIFSLEGINKVIFNDRLSFLATNNTYYLAQNTYMKILGIGYNNPLKLVEIDIFDILYRYGLVGLFLTITTLIYMFKNLSKDKKGILVAIILIMISLTSGHVLISPAVCLYFGITLLMKEENINCSN